MAALLAGVWLVAAQGAGAATLRVINRDAPGEGFNDSSPVLAVGGNNGTTLGEQRLIAFQYAADQWGRRLASPVEIRISANFNPLSCSSTNVTLGEAGPAWLNADFVGAPLANTFYPAALANVLAGTDIDPDEDEIEATFNSSFGTTCPFPAGWYYGLDGLGGDDSDFVTVVLHELAHGLGFLSLVNVETGARYMGSDDVFMRFLVSARSGKHFDEMSAAERREVIEDPGFLRWDGPNVVATSNSVQVGVDELGRVEMYAPAFAQVGSSISHWSDEVRPFELLAPFFVGPNHELGLALPALVDLGWELSTPSTCAGDCGANGAVTIEELIAAVRIALGDGTASDCFAADRNDDGAVGINELVAAVGAALDGCPSG